MERDEAGRLTYGEDSEKKPKVTIPEEPSPMHIRKHPASYFAWASWEVPLRKRPVGFLLVSADM